MKGTYTVTGKVTGISTNRTLLMLQAPADRVSKLIAAEVSAPAGLKLDCSVAKITSGFGSASATSVTPAKHESNDQNAGSSVKVDVSANEPTYSTTEAYGRKAPNSAGGWFFDRGHEDQVFLEPGEAWAFAFGTASPARLTFSSTSLSWRSANGRADRSGGPERLDVQQRPLADAPGHRQPRRVPGRQSGWPGRRRLDPGRQATAGPTRLQQAAKSPTSSAPSSAPSPPSTRTIRIDSTRRPLLSAAAAAATKDGPS